MTSSVFDQWSQYSKFSLAPLLELNGITTRLCVELARQNIKVMNELMKSNSEQLNEMSHAKSLPDVMQAQTQWTNKTMPQLVEHAQVMLDAYVDGASEYCKWLEKGVSHFQNQAETATQESKHQEKAKATHRK